MLVYSFITIPLLLLIHIQVESTLDQIPNVNTIESTINDTLNTIDAGEIQAQEITEKATNASTTAQQILNEVTDESNVSINSF